MLITPPLVVEWSICDVYVSLGVSEDILMDRQTNKLHITILRSSAGAE